MPENDDGANELQAVPSSGRRKSFRSPNYVEIYANTSQGAYTAWDIELTFGRLGTLEGEPAVEEHVTVMFSPQHAKAVSKVLANAVENWERIHGEIVLSASQQP